MAEGEQVPIETDLGRLDIVQGLDGIPDYEALRSRPARLRFSASLSPCARLPT